MAEIIKILAGAPGGNFNDLIDDLGTPGNFSLSSHSAKRYVFSEEGGKKAVLDVHGVLVGTATDDLHLRAADGHVLLTVNWQTSTWLIEPKFADGVLNMMVDTVQTAASDGQPMAFKFIGNRGNDIFHGSARADNLSGAGGADALSGLAGNDSLLGGSGDDSLNGGLGRDRMTGNGGADTFVSDSVAAARGDKITDFSLADGDRIDLRLVDAIAGNVGVDAFNFIGSDPFGHHAGELRFGHGKVDSFLKGDIDGDGKADFTIILSGLISFDSAAFDI